MTSTEGSTGVDNAPAILLRELARVRAENDRLRRRAKAAQRSRDNWREKYHNKGRTLARHDPRHGTANGYNNLGCRCKACTAAWSAAHLEYTHRTGRHKPWEAYVAEARAVAEARDNHGTESRYSNVGCRCDKCRAAAAAARRRRRHNGTVGTHNATGYRNGCRCDVCRESHNERMRQARAASRSKSR